MKEEKAVTLTNTLLYKLNYLLNKFNKITSVHHDLFNFKTDFKKAR